MSELDDFIDLSAPEATATAGEPIIIGDAGPQVNAVFDNENMAVGIERYGDMEDVTDSCVIAKADLDSIPSQKTRILRVNTNERYYIKSVDIDGGHVELMLYREGKRGNG